MTLCPNGGFSKSPSPSRGACASKRFAFFEQLIAPLVKPLRILDVGGTEDFWQSMGFGDRDDMWVTLLNVTAVATSSPQFVSIAGDARDLSQFKRREFDVVFSNSVIEHVGDFADQKRMADEVQRVGKRYFVQTPNRYFPIEPHFLFPCFQFLPEACRSVCSADFDWALTISSPIVITPASWFAKSACSRSGSLAVSFRSRTSIASGCSV